MDLLDIGIIVIGWIAFSALLAACATAAGRADRQDRRVRVAATTQRTPKSVPSTQPLFRTRRARPSERVGTDRRVPAGMRTAIH